MHHDADVGFGSHPGAVPHLCLNDESETNMDADSANARERTLSANGAQRNCLLDMEDVSQKWASEALLPRFIRSWKIGGV